MAEDPQYLSGAVARRYPLLAKFSSRFRQRRVTDFIRLLGIEEGMSILDVGGEPYFWEHFPVRCRVVCLNLAAGARRQGTAGVEMTPPTAPGISAETYDGASIPYGEGAFDIVHANSVIEHVGDFLSQRRFANEIARVGRKYWVQVPYFYFPFEPHAFLPFFQFLPANLKMLVLSKWHRAGYDLDNMLSIRLLTVREMRNLFPGATIHRERFLGLTKSLCAFRA